MLGINKKAASLSNDDGKKIRASALRIALGTPSDVEKESADKLADVRKKYEIIRGWERTYILKGLLIPLA